MRRKKLLTFAFWGGILICVKKGMQRLPDLTIRQPLYFFSDILYSKRGKGETDMLTAITGVNWGDEGKGRMVDLLSRDYDIVARYQGGNNAGHTVKNERGKFILNLLPSGILRPGVVCVMGGGMVIDPAHLEKEIAALREQGIQISPENLKISDRATVCMPWHVAEDGLEEDRLSASGSQFGSTRRGIAYAYGDKYMKKTLRMGDLVHLD